MEKKYNNWGGLTEIPHNGKVNTMDKAKFKEQTIDGERYAMIRLDDKTLKDLMQEIMLLKGVYGSSTSDNSKHLDSHLKEVGSCLGL